MTENNNFCFYGNNRGIVKANVASCYAMINKYGYQPSLGKIKVVTGSDLGDEKLHRVSVVAIRSKEPISITNYKIELKPVTDSENRDDLEAIVDGQHRLIALLILQIEGKTTINSDMIEIAKVPDGMSLPLFTSLINHSKPWTYEDFGNKVSTGDAHIDYLENLINEKKLKADVIYCLYTLGKADLKPAAVKDLKIGINKLPKKLLLDDETQKTGDKLLATLEASNISKDTYNNGRFAKGLKLWYKEMEEKPTVDEIVDMIKSMNKNVWHTSYSEPTGSAEARQYADNFKCWFNNK